METLAKIISIIFLFISSYFPSCADANDVNLPDDFNINIYAQKLKGPRFMALSPDDVVFVTEIRSGQVIALPDIDSNGGADKYLIKAKYLRNPHGIAFYKDWLYVGETHQIVRYRYSGYKNDLGKKEIIIPNLPRGGHITKTIIFGNDNRLYLSMGSSCNVCEEKDKRRAAIMQFNADGSGGKIYAKGLRNSVGLTIHPKTSQIWASDNGRDWLGDDLPPEEINIIKEGKHYGWPKCYGDKIADPEINDPKFCKNTESPVFNMQAHSVPLGLTFYTGSQFPKEYWGDLFVAFHGSWNRSVPTGYKVVRIKIKDNMPVSIEDFASGWLKGTTRTARPVDVLVNKDGSLLVSDDRGGKIFRISYTK
jgi:glucose/arabinose dehydrogenase